MALRLVVSASSDAQSRAFRYDFDADRTQILLGRRGGVDVLLPHPAVSLVHARIERDEGGYHILDDRSTNGTWLNGERLDPGQARPLSEGDRLAIGEFVVEVAALAADDATAGESSISIARRMVAEVLDVLGPGAAPTLVALPGPGAGARFALDAVGRTFVVGSAAGCDVVLADPSVAPEHARLRREASGVIASGQGALQVNDQPVSAERSLRDGDVLAIGRVRLRFGDPAELYLRQLEQAPEQPPKEVRPAPGLPSSTPSAPRASRDEALVIGGAIAVGALALAGLVYLLLG